MVRYPAGQKDELGFKYESARTNDAGTQLHTYSYLKDFSKQEDKIGSRWKYMQDEKFAKRFLLRRCFEIYGNNENIAEYMQDGNSGCKMQHCFEMYGNI